MRTSLALAWRPALLLLLLSVSQSPALAGPGGTAKWPRWRGPSDNGSIDTGSYPIKFDATTNVAWKVALPGKGCSTPAVWNDRIYVTAPIERQDGLLAFDLNGKQLWQITLGSERERKNRNGSGCNPSPATDGDGVFVYFKSGTLAAVNLDGKLRWKTNLQERYGKDTLYWDIGTSPVLTEKDVVTAVMHHGGSYLAAFDKLTGGLHWKISRDYSTPEEGDHSYATPIVLRLKDRETILVWGGQHLTAHDASDGGEIWSCGEFNPEDKLNWVAVASPVVAGNVVVVPYGRGTRLHGISLSGQRLWERRDTGCFVPTPAAYKGRVYLLHDRGDIECIDPANGGTLWIGKLPRSNASYYSSPLIANDKIYAAREDGVIFVARVDEQFELLARNEMAERIIASPVPLGNSLLIRGEQHLFCLSPPK